jgi:hypothetical protein
MQIQLLRLFSATAFRLSVQIELGLERFKGTERRCFMMGCEQFEKERAL